MIAFLSNPLVLGAWVLLMLISLGVLLFDLARNNAHLMSLMKAVWGLTVLYSGPLGLAIYWYSGRKEISKDSDLRRGFRSVAHCYSGCGMGEIIGVVICVGLLALGNLWTSLVTFGLAFVFGIALTVGPLMQEGVAAGSALRDALAAETPSIAVMEIVAIAVGLGVGGGAGMGQVLFWTSLVLSLGCGLLAAWPVNVALIRFGVKEGMMDPRNTGDTHS